MTKTFEQLCKQFGTVEHGNKTLALTQQAYVNNHGTDGGVRYFAAAVDAEGNEYQVEWDTTAAWDEAYKAARNGDDSGYCDDESNACDWDTPAKVTAL